MSEVLLPLRISIYNSTVIDMKSIDIENENVQRHLSTNEERNKKSLEEGIQEMIDLDTRDWQKES